MGRQRRCNNWAEDIGAVGRRAARLIDELEELGVEGPSRGGGREREVLIGREDDYPS